MLGVSVAVPGPPPVRMKTVSKILKASISRKRPTTTSNGASIGTVRRKKICTAEAPSTAAARKGPTGKACRPARKASIMKGVHCQMSTKISA